jgi:2-polyprenyl-3-methyl-5-hydroxy-6-metoxy-1,4-benzoquinol methylase
MIKPQDVLFILIILLLIWKRNPKYFVIAGLLSIIIAMPLFHFWVFFTAERLVWYAAGFLLLAIILFIFDTKEENKSDAYQNQQYFKNHESNFISKTVIQSIIKEVIILAEKNTGKKIQDMVVLDVGSGFGGYSFELEKYAKQVVGVEPDTHAYSAAVKEARFKKSKVEFHNALIECFSTKTRFDLVLSLTTIEHMPDQQASFKKILSLMNKNAMLYVTAPNKWWIVEQHYGLPFLSWLPVPLANFYVKQMHKADSFQDSSYSLSYFGMKKLFSSLPCTYQFYLPSQDAAYLGCGQDKNSIYASIRNVGISLIRKYPIFWSISKGFIVLVKKR